MIRLTLTVGCFLIALTPAVASAQTIDSNTRVVETVPVNAPTRLDAKQAGITRSSLAIHAPRHESASVATVALAQSRVRRGQTLMIVGGAAFLAGLIIGDDVGTAIAGGGAVVGIYGLYLWAQTQ